MTLEAVSEITRTMLLTALLVASPVLLTALVVGLFVSILQAITQIHEMTLTFIPKILSIVTMLLLLIPWILQTLVNYAERTFSGMNNFLDLGIRF
ncbi:flagellar biosynthesis protein FliQ [Candidatus Poribacteria bacterium]|jgi:flagellar biosynthesis protein FliQ|nr:flagellar biosynthesis protein FliQ [Candidatus Poribacteria bacterium]MBT5533082.1 flagellar biosynthesis protein FliQ [Candidatus Poribacteria bacterium]MBT5709574.1 flagellar biosynthesis protein FliQ [Candidatus Poribacteria bacterium]MBT7098565.1 flagellar biosynthesis protein FliQ [Candidatus Poribacteria bacterium]MBT7809148.1 flagellar biosynthesis protein FliQ [Candidatus Poribacteria bacterium]